ncbi:MAG: hypothetical protein AAGH79_00435 [Bacteroidota bacterium]
MSESLKFRLLESELRIYGPALGTAADTVLDQGVSKYPIFVAHQQTVDMGIPIFDREKVSGNWSVNVSTLEEFVTKQIIAPDKVDEFKKVYKDPAEEVCIFVLSELGANFIYIPRSKKVK